MGLSAQAWETMWCLSEEIIDQNLGTIASALSPRIMSHDDDNSMVKRRGVKSKIFLREETFNVMPQI